MGSDKTVIYSPDEIEEITLIFSNRVYPPYEDSELLAQTVWSAPFYSRVFDIGTGTGIQSLVYAKKHRKSQVISIDISRSAVVFALRNAIENNVSSSCEFVRTSSYNCFRKNIHPSLWVCNPPYLLSNPEIDPLLTKEEQATLSSGVSGFDFSSMLINSYSQNAGFKDCLYLLTSSLSCPFKFNETLKKKGLCSEVIAETHLFFETLKVHKIFLCDNNE